MEQSREDFQYQSDAVEKAGREDRYNKVVGEEGHGMKKLEANLARLIDGVLGTNTERAEKKTSRVYGCWSR